MRPQTCASSTRKGPAFCLSWALARALFGAAIGLAGLSALVVGRPAFAQQVDVGHKLPGTIGLRAGSVPRDGLYVQDALVYFTADRLIDRSGRRIPADFDLGVLSDVIGAGASYELPSLRIVYTVAVGVPLTRIRATSIRLESDVDRYGLGDVYVKPAQLGARLPHVDLIASYAFYAPTGRFEPGPRGGVSSAQWTNQYALGGTVYFDRARTWQLSALASYDQYGRKAGIDITRGDIVQIQGGLGKTLFRVVDVGFASYALWQVRDDRGSALPAALRGARDQAFGLGPEVAATIPAIRARFALRYEHDLRSRSRPYGQILFFSASVKAW